MSDLRELMSEAGRLVADPAWASPVALREQGRRRTNRRRLLVGVGAVTAAAVAFTLVISTSRSHDQAVAPDPVVPVRGCLAAVHADDRDPSPYQVVVGGRRVLLVDLASGSTFPRGVCGPVGLKQQVLTVAGARVVAVQGGTVSVTGPSGRAVSIDAGDGEVYPTASGGILVVRWAGGNVAHLATYDANGRPTSTVTAPSLFAVRGSTPEGILGYTFSGASTGTGTSSLALFDPADGHVLRALGTTNVALGFDQRRVAWLVPGSDGAVSQTFDKTGTFPVACVHTCPELKVTDLVTGDTVSFPRAASTRPYTGAVFSPDGTRLALVTSDDPDSQEGASVTVLTLGTGEAVTVPGVHSAGNRFGPPVSWTPDSAALVIAETDGSGVRLQVWHRTGGSLTHAATLAGDADGATVDVVGPGLSAWDLPVPAGRG